MLAKFQKHYQIFFQVKPQNVAKWLKDKRWLKKPEEGIIEIEKVNKLKVWLHNLTLTDDIEDLKIQFDWENNKPTKKDAGGLMTDPYNPIRGEQYFIQVGKFFFEKKVFICSFLTLMMEKIILSQEEHEN